MINIIHTTGSNITNLYNCLIHIDTVDIVKRPAQIKRESHTVILPGNGHFKSYLHFLTSHGWPDFLLETQKTVIGICSGYHSLCLDSDESPGTVGIKIFNSHVQILPKSLSISNFYKTPHTGFKTLLGEENGTSPEKAFFTHNYGVIDNHSATITHRVEIGDRLFVAAEEKDNYLGLQYHPELSGIEGRFFLDKIIREKRNGKIWTT